jgi:hypothetical protein
LNAVRGISYNRTLPYVFGLRRHRVVRTSIVTG